jgi:iron(III) transport system substrate-binding protein
MSPADRRYDRRTFLALAGAGAAVACLGPAESPSPSPVVTTASLSPRTAAPLGTLVVYSALEESTTNELLTAFVKADPGVRMDLAALAAADELETRLRVEQKARKADLFVGGASAYHDALGKDGILDAYVSATSALVPSALKERTGLWTGWYEDVLGLAVNADRVAKELPARPATWDDLLDPAWKGKLIVPDPVRTDAGYVFLATQLFRFGRDEAKAIDYLAQLHQNVAQYPGDAARVAAMVARGDAVGAPSWGHDVLADATRKTGLQFLAPRDAGVEVGAVSIVKGSSSLAATRAFVEWVGGRDAQTIIAKTGGRTPTRALAATPAGSPSLAGLDPARYDRRFASDIRGRLLARWRDAVGRT